MSFLCSSKRTLRCMLACRATGCIAVRCPVGIPELPLRRSVFVPPAADFARSFVSSFAPGFRSGFLYALKEDIKATVP